MRGPSLVACALAACVPYVAPPEDDTVNQVEAHVPEMLECHLDTEPPPVLAMPGSDLAKLRCTATNRHASGFAICGRPYIGVLATGMLHTPHDSVCSSTLGFGDQENFDVALDFSRRECARDGNHNGCIVHTFSDLESEAAAIVGFAAALEQGRPFAGALRPTVDECRALVEQWNSEPAFAALQTKVHPFDASIVSCLGLSRAQLACLTAAVDTAAVAQCSAVTVGSAAR